MAKRSTTPALYELIRSRATPRAARPAPPEPPPTPPPTPKIADSESFFTPGRVVRVPVGYLWLALAGFMLVAVISYMFGFNRGEQAQESRLNEQAGELALQNVPANDPLKMKESRPEPPAGNQQPKSSSPRNEGQPRNQAGSTDAEPRENGLNYYVIDTRSSTPQMKELVTFCQQQGLDARLVRDNNGGPPKVIVLPGFKGADLKGKAAADLESKIKSVGKLWQKQGVGRSDLSSYYPERFKG